MAAVGNVDDAVFVKCRFCSHCCLSFGILREEKNKRSREKRTEWAREMAELDMCHRSKKKGGKKRRPLSTSLAVLSTDCPLFFVCICPKSMFDLIKNLSQAALEGQQQQQIKTHRDRVTKQRKHTHTEIVQKKGWLWKWRSAHTHTTHIIKSQCTPSPNVVVAHSRFLHGRAHRPN